ncbi:MAG: WD40 repeat domain-containing protein [Bacteroidia bacterium]
MRLVGDWNLLGHAGPIYALTYDYASKHLYSGGADGLVAEWDSLKGQPARAIARVPAAIYALHWLPNSTQLYVGESSGRVYVLDLARKALVRLHQAHQGAVFGLFSHPTDAEGWSSGRDGHFLFWDTQASEPYARLLVSEAGLRGFALHPKGQHFLCAARDGCLYEIDRATRQVQRQIPADPELVFTVQYCPTSPLAASGGKSGTLRLWDADFQCVWEVAAHTYALNTLAWHPSGKWLATGGRDRLIHIWDVTKKVKRLTLRGHQRSVNALLWLGPDTLASAGDDGLIKIWHLEEADE